jgi:hypothetical protein
MTEPAQFFRDMAARIEKVEKAEFAGAAVVVPPGGGEAITFLLTDPQQHILQFFTTIKSRVEEKATEHMEQARNRQQGWPVR